MRFTYSIFLPVLNETSSLTKTIEIIEKNCNENTFQYLIIISKKKTASKSIVSILNIKKKYKKKIKIIYQKKPHFGGALLSAIEAINTTHFIMMASDLETNPYHVKKLIKKSISFPNSIIVASRWKKKNSFKNYNKIKYFCNKLFQIFFSILFKTKLNDLTFGYRVYPSKIIKKIKFKENKHPIMLESLLIPLKFNLPIKSVDTSWKSRTEGFSSNSFLANFNYFMTGFRIYLSNNKNLLKN